MNNRFKFRIWDKNNKCYLNTTNGLHFELMYGGLRTVSWFVGQNEYTIEQCTGSTDINEKLIYEGDIILSKFNGMGRIAYYHSSLCVIWKDNVQYFDQKTTLTPIPLDTHNVEIIGNINENIEIIRGEIEWIILNSGYG